MPSAISTQREAPAEETAPILGWSSLPNDLIYRIGDCLLADEDVESYMDFRAVCKGWRDPTMGPKEMDRAKPGRFLPRKWALLDRHGNVLTFVNIETGRFLVKNIPLLHNYFFVGATGGGMIILEEPTPPYQVRVLNPFTGLVLRFKASLPIMGWVREAAVVTTKTSMMLFISGKDDSIMWADENSEHFCEFRAEYRNAPVTMAPFGSKVYLADRGGSILSSTVAVVGEHISNRSEQTILMAKTIRSHVASGHPAWDCYLVKSEGELLLVTRPWYNVHGEPVVREVDTENNKLDVLRSIGNRALFLSDVRCLSVDASKFQGIQGGCIYFVDPILTGDNRQASLMTTFRVDEQVQVDIEFDAVTMAGGSQQPFTLSQVFANYCMSTSYSERGSK
ncbi:hypothetical protein HU200_051658 [Digitaria exilis]|uniref:KIB1-4 beta-propeller domain-containing protein n=1 Tax=Digitaria exilis TaxID=1010633 RepID=A0A835B0Q4_9POAL|nr:hypothetical protein HU200_051658 [Digitaria exilis]